MATTVTNTEALENKRNGKYVSADAGCICDITGTDNFLYDESKRIIRYQRKQCNSNSK